MSNKVEDKTMQSAAQRGLVPKLRFPEFRDEGEWEVNPLDSLLDYQQPTDYLVSDTNYSDVYKTPVLTAGKTFILGYTNEQHGIFSENLPVIIFDDFTTATQFVDFPFKAKSSAMKILQARNGVSIKFMYEAMQMISYEVGAHERHWISKFAPMSILVPKPKEQQKIADCLSSLDELITLEAQKLDTFKTYKKGLMQQLFPVEGETLPKLRFPEFRDAGEWVTKGLIDLAIGGLSNGVFNDPGKVGHGYKLINVLDMYIETPIDESALSLVGIGENEFLKNKAEPNDIFFTRSSLVKAGIAQSNIYLGSSDDVTFDGHLIRLRPDKNVIAPMFLHYALKSGYVRSQLIAKGKSATMTTIGQADVASTKLAIPLFIDEQQKIADCLSSLDDLITAQAQKLATLKTHKKGLMQQLFPALDEVQG